MAKKYLPFKVTGVANAKAEDKGITSDKAEVVKVLAILLYVTGHAGNQVRWDLARKTIGEIYDYHLDTDEDTGAANTPRSTHKINRIEVDEDIPMGQTFAVAITCGATAKDLYGAYEYESK